jgi:hypothetical protein
MHRFTPSVTYRAPNAPVAVQLGLGQTTVPQVLSNHTEKAETTKYVPAFVQPSGGAVQTRPQGGWGSRVVDLSSAGVSVPPPPPRPTAAYIPDLSTQKLSPWQQQQQTQFALQNVSVPVTVQASPTTSLTIAPPAPQDYGAMVPPSVAAGMGQFFTNRCLGFAAAGVALALLTGRRRKSR